MGYLRSDKYSFKGSAILDGVAVTQNLYPVFKSFKIDVSKVDFRKITKASGQLTFVNNSEFNVSDYDFIKKCEANGIGTRITVDVSVKGIWKYKGYFYPYQCDYNDDLCEATVSLTTDDYYTCIEKYWDTKENILKEVAPSELYRINPDVVFMTFECEENIYMSVQNSHNGTFGCVDWQFAAVGGGITHPGLGLPYNINDFNNYSSFGWYDSHAGIAQSCLPAKLTGGIHNPYDVLSLYGYSLISCARVIKSEYTHLSWAQNYTYTDNNGNSFTIPTSYAKVKTTWGLETVITANDLFTNAQVMPTGGGWIDYKTIIQNGILCTQWVRRPYYNNQVYNYCATTYDCYHAVVELIDPYINNTSQTHFIWTGRNLKDVIQMYLNKSGCNLTYESEFLNDDINPVTGQKNKLQHLQINNCSDLKISQSVPGFSPATLLEYTFKDILEGLTNKLDCHWYIDGNVFRIEHREYFENGYSYGNSILNQHNLKTIISESTNKPEIIRTNKYKYNSDKIFNKERWSDSHFFYFDFSDLSIIYDISGDLNEQLYQESFYTDVSAIFSFPDTFDDKGIVLIAIQEQVIDIATGATGMVIINETGLRSGSLVVNGHLCWSNLIPLYWQRGRVLLQGKIGTDVYNFISAANKKQQSVVVLDCDDKIQVPENAESFLGNGMITGTSWDIVTYDKQIDLEI